MSKNKGGRPPKIERDIKIWYEFYHLHKPIWEIEKEYEIGKPAVKKALEKVSKEFVKLPNEIILKGSISAIKDRMRKLTELLNEEYGRENPSTRNVKELNSEIRSEQIELNKLESIYSERYSIEVEGGNSVKQILSLLSKKEK